MFEGTKSKDSSKDFGDPKRIAVIWTDTVMGGPQGAPIRGFGGRVYFYDANDKPVRTEGELAIYAFDESNNQKNSRPDRIYKFKAEDLQQHYSHTPLGHSYSFWLPWEPVGGERKAIALLPIFKDSAGQIVRSEQTINTLSGKAPPEASNQAKQNYYVLGSSPAVATMPESPRPRGENRPAAKSFAEQQVSYETDAKMNGTENPRLRSTTIDVPRMMSNRLKTSMAETEPPAVTEEAQTTISYGANPPPAKPQSNTSANSADRPVFGTPGSFR